MDDNKNSKITLLHRYKITHKVHFYLCRISMNISISTTYKKARKELIIKIKIKIPYMYKITRKVQFDSCGIQLNTSIGTTRKEARK
jgi:hypothetical protein